MLMNENIQKFFKDLHGNNHINFRNIKNGEYIKDVNGNYNEYIINTLDQFNSQGYDCYFVVNHGGYKNEQIHQFNAVFMDFDAGRDEQRNYFSLDIVAKYKQEKLIEINQFGIKPSYIVETRNGLHVYYLLHFGATLEKFHLCEDVFIRYFNSDKAVKNPARLLRVPGTYWTKDPRNKFMTEIIEHNEVKYYIEDLINSIPDEYRCEDFGCTNRNESNTILWTPQSPKRTKTSQNNLELIRKKDVLVLQERLNPQSIILSTHKEVQDYLKHQDLEEYLGQYGNMNCFVHDDHKPSASVFVSSSTEDYIYKCHSSSCGFKGNIIQVTEQLTGLTRVDALRFLRKVYKIEYSETEWQKERREILEENKRLIFSEEFKEIYSPIYERTKNYLSILNILHDIAINHITTDYFTDKNGYPIFFTSMNYVAKLCNKDKRRLNDRIALLAYLGLINKLPDEYFGAAEPLNQ